jgi:hypothetical protein
MKLLSWIILLSSAAIYVLPFWFSTYYWWLIFVFPIPLLYVVLHERVSFKEGFAWGCVAYTLHLSGVLWGTMALAHGSYSLRVLPSLFIVLYQSVYTGLWFWLMRHIQQRYTLNHQMERLCAAWVLSLWLYSLWIDRLCLFLFDRCEGYMLMHPLIPLAEQPMLLHLLPYVGKLVLTGILYSFAGCATVALLKPTRKHILFCGAALLPWIASIFLWSITPRSSAPDWLTHIACLPKKFPKMENLSVTARILREEIREILEKHPQVDIIIIPESSVYSQHLLSTPALAAHLGPDHLGKSVQLLIGSFYDDDGKYRNACYWLKDGIVQHRFDKRHAMLMIERMPRLFRSSLIQTMYFNVMPEIISSGNVRPCLTLTDSLCAVPYLCSELFFNEYPDDTHGSTPIILMANDAWCPISYIRHLMYLSVRFKALQWRRDILYTSYYYAVLCTRDGHTYPIPTTSP